MLRRGKARYTRLALALGSLLILTGCSTSDFEDKATFGWPHGVTEQGHKMRVLWTWTSVAALTVGVIVWFLIFWACGRYRKKKDDDTLPRQTKYNLPLEIVYTIVPFLIIAGLFYYTVVTENFVLKKTANPDVRVQVTGFKWNWQFDYVSNQGQPTKFEGSDTNLYTVGSTDVIPILVIPVNKTIRVVEHSDDVIHSFWVPEFLFKMDVIPYGSDDTTRDNQFEFKAVETGSFVGRCAELCGTYHSMMNFEVRIVDGPVFDKYLAELAKLDPGDPGRQAKALVAAGMGPVATTTHPFNPDRHSREESKQVGASR